MNSLKELWSETLEMIQNEVAEAPYISFIKPIKPVSIDYTNEIITLQAENEYSKERLIERYKNPIEMSLKDVCGIELKTEFIVENKSLQKDAAQVKQNEFINPKYTFDNFVIGKANNFAHAAANAVAKAPAEIYNPLFIYGGAGLGKTHLINAIANDLAKNRPELDVLYVSSETFVNEMVESIKNKTNNEFRNKYRSVDVLIIDDIQFLEKKEGTQEEFFHTFNTLYNNHKQIIITSDKPPKEMQNLEERLKSRFGWSLIADINPPDIETRNAILRKKAEQENMEITPGLLEAIDYIAEKIQYNVRELEGALIRVSARSKLENTPISREFAKNILKDVYVDKDKALTTSAIKESVSRYFNIKVSEIESSKRSRNLAYPRQIAMYLCRELTKLSLPKIGEEFGNRDHTTVIHAHSKIEAEIKVNSNLNEIVQTLISELKS
ncbi:MAG: chromosomal replication initiator protein DnaA [Bacillota bacterium]|nr:chromosomal replication initiator protein DnaA [Bacillota bacterium]